MARTYRNTKHAKSVRHPRGHKQALVRGSRNKAIPPSAWDDKPVAGRKEVK